MVFVVVGAVVDVFVVGGAVVGVVVASCCCLVVQCWPLPPRTNDSKNQEQ